MTCWVIFSWLSTFSGIENTQQVSFCENICLSVHWNLDTEITKKTIQGSFMKPGIWTGGNVHTMHVILFGCCLKIVVAMVTDNQ